MKYLGFFGVAALGLLIAVAAFFVNRREPAVAPVPAAKPSEAPTPKPPTPPPTPVTRPPTPVSPSPSGPPLPASEAPGVARKIAELLDAVKVRREAARAAGTPLPPEEQKELRDKETEASKLGRDLAGSLKADPSAWQAVLDILGALPEVNTAVRIASMVGTSVNDATEPVVAAMLNPGGSVAARRVALVLLSNRMTESSLPPLMTAAENDPDVTIRKPAISAVGTRFRRTTDPEAKKKIEDFLRRRSTEDPEKEVRDVAAAMVSGQRPGPPMPGRRPGFPHPTPTPTPTPR